MKKTGSTIALVLSALCIIAGLAEYARPNGRGVESGYRLLHNGIIGLIVTGAYRSMKMRLIGNKNKEYWTNELVAFFVVGANIWYHIAVDPRYTQEQPTFILISILGAFVYFVGYLTFKDNAKYKS